MASQQILFAETIAGMKKAFKRKAYESDSDSEIENYGNRGHKMQKRARFANKGQLVPSAGPSAYKEPVDYAGVRRSIIYRNPPLLDDEGYEVDSEDDDQRIEDAVLEAAEMNPYANIRLENIFAPLTASTDLPTHPTISKPFTSNTLTDLVSQSSSIMRKENHSLWQVRHLWTSLCGDSTWMPCETMIGPNDAELYSEDHVARHLLNLSRAGDADAPVPGTANGDAPTETAEEHGAQQAHGDADVPMTDDGPADKDVNPRDQNNKADGKDSGESKSVENGASKEREASVDNQDPANEAQLVNGTRSDSDRHDNQALSATSEASQPHFVHPLFVPPATAKPDRDLGLPQHEAEDIRRLLALYVQKQEEVCRGAERLHIGLMKAERLRKDVLRWSKAEAHSGVNRDMSDGEDWYDKEEWGLIEDLKKGQDEEEEDTTTTGKKTRTRRQ